MPPFPLVSHQQVVAGDDCKAVDGRALTWTSSAWPNLTGATLSMVIGHDQYNLYGNLPVTWAAPIQSGAASGAQIATMDVTAAQTGALSAGQYDYTLTAKLADADVVTLAAGYLTVVAPPTNIPLYPAAV